MDRRASEENRGGIRKRRVYLYAVLAVTAGIIVGLLPILLFGPTGFYDWFSNITESDAAEETRVDATPVADIGVDQLSLDPDAAAALQSSLPVDFELGAHPSFGPEDAPVLVVEFTDYECPFCARHARDVLPDLAREFRGRMRYTMVHFPIASIHPSARKAAEAAECAQDQDRFWDYHKLLFRFSPDIGRERLFQHAEGLGMNVDEFQECLDSGRKAEIIDENLELGRQLGVSGTPTFFVNGLGLAGARSLERFRAILEAAIEP
jgi:protein-disulfide isomerase